MEMRDEPLREITDRPHGNMRVMPAIAGAAVMGFVVLVAFGILFAQRLQYGLRPEAPVQQLPILPAFSEGVTLVPLLIGIVALVLVGIFFLLLILVMCTCCCKGGGPGLPLPPLPDLRKLAAILREIARALRNGADAIADANTVVNDARSKLASASGFTVRVPKFRSIGHVTVGPFSGEAFAPDGFEDRSPFDDDAKRKLNSFTDDVTGKAALDGAAGLLRNKATVLDQQADVIDPQS
jgi:hypothetical protein